MRELIGDLWQRHADGAVVAITTSGMVSRSGNAVLLRGCAKQAKDRFPELARTLGALIQQDGNRVFYLGCRLVSFPVEEDPFCHPELSLIERSCRELVALTDERGWTDLVVPRPGCGSGGLAWADVRAVLGKHFDDRFQVITAGENENVYQATQGR